MEFRLGMCDVVLRWKLVLVVGLWIGWRDTARRQDGSWLESERVLRKERGFVDEILVEMYTD